MSQLVEKHLHLKEAVKLAVQESSNMKNVSEEVLRKVVIETIHKYQQKVNVGIEDSVTDLIDVFKQKVSDQIFRTSSGWRVVNRDYFLFPRGCRFCFTKGENTIVVIEQEPQIRSLLLSGNIIEEKDHFPTSSRSERIPLSLPYIVFILQFKNDVFTAMYSGWRTSPLRSLDDMLFKPILPNVHETLNICMGKVSGDLGSNISQRSDAVMGHFWNSMFNNDLSKIWWKKKSFHHKLATARTWAKATIEDSSFILNASMEEGKSVKSIINLITMHDLQPDENFLRQNLSNSIDGCVEAMFAKIMRYFKSTKFERYHPKDINDIMANAMVEANSELASLVLVIKNELEKLDKQIAESKESSKIEPRSPKWSEYFA